MSQVIRKNGHKEVSELLPWYVNGTLDDHERATVVRHLETCRDCRDNVELLMQVGQAVLAESPTPLVPSPRAQDLLSRIDQPSVRGWPGARWPRIAAAASVIAVAIVIAALIANRYDDIEPSAMYETATSGAAVIDAIDYVIELRLVPGFDTAARERLFGAIKARQIGPSEGADVYRATVRLQKLSLAELERYIDEIESKPEIAAARVVAVQLPVE